MNSCCLGLLLTNCWLAPTSRSELETPLQGDDHRGPRPRVCRRLDLAEEEEIAALSLDNAGREQSRLSECEDDPGCDLKNDQSGSVPSLRIAR